MRQDEEFELLIFFNTKHFKCLKWQVKIMKLFNLFIHLFLEKGEGRKEPSHALPPWTEPAT